MDVPLHWTLDYLQDLLPNDLRATLENTLLADGGDARVNPNDDPFLPNHPLLSYLHRALASLAAAVLPLAASALDTLASLLAAAPDLVAAAAVLVLAALLLQVLALARRLLLFWTRLLFRLAFWAAAVALASAVWRRGVERSFADAAAVGGVAVRWVASVVEVWAREYERARATQAQAREYGQGQGHGQGQYAAYQGRRGY